MNSAASTVTAVASFTVWRKSARSEPTANCVEVAAVESGAARRIGVRDSKNPSGPYLQFTPDAWAAFVARTTGQTREPIPQASREDDGVITEYIPAEQIPADHRSVTKVFEPGHQAITMRSTADPRGPVLYFSEAEWDAFVAAVTDGEFDDLLDALTDEHRRQNQ